MIKIYNKDCLEVLNYNQLVLGDYRKGDIIYDIPHKSIDCVIADLPYFQVVKNEWDNQWDSLDEYINWVNMILKILDKYYLNFNANIILFTGRQHNRHICKVLDDYFDEQRIIIWARKRAFNNTRGKALASGYEPICYYSKGDSVFNNIKIQVDSKRKEYTDGILKDGITLSDVWDDIPALPHNSKEKVNHPTQKPIKLMERIVSLFSNKGDIVLDFCMGSGTTGVACKNLGRNFIGIEMDKQYFDIAKTRLN